MSIITFIGAGQMASALTFPSFENGHTIRLVGTPLDKDIIEQLMKDDFHPTLKRYLHHGIEYYQIDQVESAIEGADAILCGVSSFGVDWFKDEILPKLNPQVPMISVTKGMICCPDGQLMTYVDYWKNSEAGKKLNIHAIGGPCTSYELADKDHSWVAFCGENIETLRYLKSLFEQEYYHISLSTDVVGVECAVAMKNAYALGVTLAVGLAEKREGKGAVHYNSQAALFGQSVKEMRALLKLVGAKDDNIIYGAGDLYVTIFGGRTRMIGTLLGSGYSFDQAMEQLQGVTLESIVISSRTAQAIRILSSLGKVKAEDFPLLMHVDEIINQGKEVNIPWKDFEVEAFD